jgi:type I restriction enzyme S subunit
MELKPGYTLTEVGLIPEDWRLSTLFDISKRITDGEHLTPKRSSNGYYLLSARNILDGRIDLSDVDYVGPEEYRRIRQRCNPEPGDILISCSGTVGRVAIVPDGFECVMVRSAALVKPDFTKVSGHYAQYFLQSAAGQNQILVSLNQGAQANLFLNHIQDLCIALPPTKAEQEDIAEALGDADALIECVEQLIAKKRDLKQGAMQELLTGKKRLPGFIAKTGFKQTEAGIIPADWEVVHLGSLLAGSPTYGINAPAIPFDSRHPTYLRITDISEAGRFNADSKASVKHALSASYVLNDGDLVFARTGASVGKSYLYDRRDGELVFAGFLIRVRPNPKRLEPAYLKYFTHSSPYWNWVKVNSMRSGQPGINGREYAALPIPLPPTKAEQEAIATILFDMDAEIVALQLKLAKTRSVKQAMMQELLTGRIRLVSPKEAHA